MARERVFRFKQFEVINDRTAMKVGTDGVLLGAWCPVEGATRVLDVGTGCGVIALMIAQRNGIAAIDGIDIDWDAIDEATINFERSPWHDRLKAQALDFNLLTAEPRYDLIVSNPPFFTNGVLPTGDARTVARHTSTLTYQSLIGRSSRLLAENGSLALISPAEAEPLIIEASTFASLPVKRLVRVIPVEGAAPKRILWLLSLNDGVSYAEGSLTIAHRDNSFTQEYIHLTRDFYLKM